MLVSVGGNSNFIHKYFYSNKEFLLSKEKFFFIKQILFEFQGEVINKILYLYHGCYTNRNKPWWYNIKMIKIFIFHENESEKWENEKSWK